MATKSKLEELKKGLEVNVGLYELKETLIALIDEVEKLRVGARAGDANAKATK